MILLTGASGFVGTAIFKKIVQQSNLTVRTYGRRMPAGLVNYNEGNFEHLLGGFSCETNYASALEGVKIVIHCAAQAHVMNNSKRNEVALYKDVNVDSTINLASQAIAAGVKKFIFISTLKVNGENTNNRPPFNNESSPSPSDAYSRSKHEAEEKLRQLVFNTNMELVVIRPPLVYGPGVKGNFSVLLSIVRKNLLLPFGAIHNKRSMVSIDNLVDLVFTCIEHKNAGNKTFLVSDDQDVSTTELLRMMAHAFGKKTRLIPIPMSWILGVASLLGKKAVADRLCGSLQVDITHTKETLGWKPPVTMEQQLAKIAASMSSPRDA